MSGRWKSRVDGSMLIPVLLAQVKLLHPVLRRAGVDIPQFDTILRTKLMLDQFGGPKGSIPISGVYALMMSGYWLFGLFLAIPTILIARGSLDVDAGLWLAAAQTLTAGMLGFPLIAQYTSLFVDTTDIAIVGPTPVNDATLFASRLVHAALYTGVLAACVSFGPIVSGVFAYRWWAVLLVYPIATLLTVALVVSSVGALYGGALRIFGPRRFERITLWIQVVLLSLAMGGGQLVMRVSVFRGAVESVVADPRLLVWVPTVHAGAWLELLSGAEPTSQRLLWAALAIIVPSFALWLAIRLAAQHFVDGLTSRPAAPARGRGWRSGAARRLRRLARSPAEDAVIPMTTAMIRHDKMLVRAVWPQVIGMTVLGVALPVMLADSLSNLDVSPKWYALAVFMTGLADVAIGDSMRISQNGEASWLLSSLGLRDQHGLVRGAIKAAFFGLFLPSKLVLVAVLVTLYGPEMLAHAFVAGALSIAMSFQMMRALTLRLPFSLTPTSQADQDFTNLSTYFAAIVGQVALGGVFALSLLHWTAEAALAVVAVAWLIKSYRRIDELEVVPEPSP